MFSKFLFFNAELLENVFKMFLFPYLGTRDSCRESRQRLNSNNFCCLVAINLRCDNFILTQRVYVNFLSFITDALAMLNIRAGFISQYKKPLKG